MSVAKQNVRAITVPIGRARGMTADGFDIGWFAIGVEIGSDILGNGRHVTDPDHIRRPFDGGISDGSLKKGAIDVATEAELRPGDGFGTILKMDAPIVVSQAEERCAGNSVRIINAAGTGAAKHPDASGIHVQIRIPGRPGLGRGTGECVAIVPHEAENASGPNITILG